MTIITKNFCFTLKHAKKAKLEQSDYEFTYVSSSLPPQRVFTLLLNVRSTCLVRSHSRCTENTAAPSRSSNQVNVFLRAAVNFLLSFSRDVTLIVLKHGLRIRWTNKAAHYVLSKISTKPRYCHRTDGPCFNLLKKKRNDFQENLPDGVSLPSIFVHGRSLNTQRFKHRR